MTVNDDTAKLVYGGYGWEAPNINDFCTATLVKTNLASPPIYNIRDGETGYGYPNLLRKEAIYLHPWMNVKFDHAQPNWYESPPDRWPWTSGNTYW